jgi:hypothetical protein
MGEKRDSLPRSVATTTKHIPQPAHNTTSFTTFTTSCPLTALPWIVTITPNIFTLPLIPNPRLRRLRVVGLLLPKIARRRLRAGVVDWRLLRRLISPCGTLHRLVARHRASAGHGALA